VLVDGDPLTEAGALAGHVHTVIQAGTVVGRV
jgi:hypothetical protein